jgi:hypothetical protein
MVAAKSAETDDASLQKAGFLVFTCEQRNTPWSDPGTEPRGGPGGDS